MRYRKVGEGGRYEWRNLANCGSKNMSCIVLYCLVFFVSEEGRLVAFVRRVVAESVG